MKGVVLAGGTGSRLFPLTKITNKHLLPIYDKPMIYYPIQTLVDAGIQDILIVTGGRNSGDFLRLLANGKQFGLKHINYTYQEGEGGIADALALAEHFADGQKICVILGDNIIEGSIREAAEQFPQAGRGRAHPAEGSAGRGALRRGRSRRRPASSASKRSRKQPKSNYAVTGIYMYDATVFDKIKTLVPSRPRRTGNHRRQQRLHPRRHHDLLLPRRLVDRRRHVRIAAARGQSGGAIGRAEGRSRRAGSGGTRLMAQPSVLACRARPLASSGDLRPGDSRMSPRGSAPSSARPNSPDLIDGVRVQPFALWPDDRGYFLEVQRIGHGLAAAFPAGDHADLGRA